jgi:hypothetical protein
MHRSGHTDAGCHQFSTESNTPNRPVTTDDVGLSSPTPWKDSPKWNPPSKGTEKNNSDLTNCSMKSVVNNRDTFKGNPYCLFLLCLRVAMLVVFVEAVSS